MLMQSIWVFSPMHVASVVMTVTTRGQNIFVYLFFPAPIHNLVVGVSKIKTVYGQ